MRRHTFKPFNTPEIEAWTKYATTVNEKVAKNYDEKGNRINVNRRDYSNPYISGIPRSRVRHIRGHRSGAAL